MISPVTFVEELKDADYNTLIEERDQLIEYIVEFEKKEKAGDRSGDEWKYNPMPDVVYQVYLDYLAELCKMMKEINCEEYIWGNKRLSDSIYLNI